MLLTFTILVHYFFGFLPHTTCVLQFLYFMFLPNLCVDFSYVHTDSDCWLRVLSAHFSFMLPTAEMLYTL
jgi:hypothetical protein